MDGEAVCVWRAVEGELKGGRWKEQKQLGHGGWREQSEGWLKERRKNSY